MKKLAFWLPGKKQHGLGHFSRTLLMVKALEKYDITPILFTNDIDEFENHKKHSFHALNTQDPREVLSFLNSNHVGFLFIDNYFISNELMANVSSSIPTCYFAKEKVNIKFDSFFNSNLYAKDILEKEYPDDRCFWGPSFRPPLENKNIIPIKKYDWFICLGASNPPDLLFELLEQFPEDQKVALVLGPGATHENIEKAKKLPLTLFHDPKNIMEIAASSHKAIISSSTLVYEMIEYGIPFSAISFVDNHLPFAEHLESHYSIAIQYHDQKLDLKRLINSAKPISNIIFGDKIKNFAEYIKSYLI